MKKLEQISQEKLISNYGGVGSIIETNTNGSLKVSDYDNWRCYNQRRNNNLNEIIDNRLLSLVRQTYPNRNVHLVSIPTPDLSQNVYYAGNDDIKDTITADRFPKWYFCPNCHRLEKLESWARLWVEHPPKPNQRRGRNARNTRNNRTEQEYYKNEPICYVDNRKLEQVRFVMASLDTGEIKDIPFDCLFSTQPDGNVWNIEQLYVNNIFYKTIRNRDGLDAIYIEHRDENNIGRNIYMSSIDRCYLVYNGHTYKMAMKGSQSLYFPNIVRSIYIPYNEGDNFATIDELELQEFRFLTNGENYRNNLLVTADENLVIRRKPELDGRVPLISNISAIERLKETSVLLSYSRLGRNSEEMDWYNCTTQAIERTNPHLKYPFRGDINAQTWIPAVESYGEGLLFEMDTVNLQVIHTLCHIIMKEMEFQCGYPLTSLKEKIYIDNDNNRAGFIIYTIGGSEGSYGGLISLTDSEKIVNLIQSGCERAKHCPNDPICLNDNAHCFACLDLPETSCCKFNNDLNRRQFLEFLENTINHQE